MAIRIPAESFHASTRRQSLAIAFHFLGRNSERRHLAPWAQDQPVRPARHAGFGSGDDTALIAAIEGEFLELVLEGGDHGGGVAGQAGRWTLPSRH